VARHTGEKEMTTDEQVLIGMLIWLRNHYDLDKRTQKKNVLKRVDMVIDHFGPPVGCHQLAREFAQKLEGKK
jgi:hypothetical protein